MAQSLASIVIVIAAIAAPLCLIDSAIRARSVYRALMNDRTRHDYLD
jgi:hypothetical protein